MRFAERRLRPRGIARAAEKKPEVSRAFRKRDEPLSNVGRDHGVDNARHWCEKVAEAHPKVAPFWRALQDAEVPTDSKAIFEFAYRFDIGIGGKKNEALAVRWYLRAAELGYAPAQRNLGGMYGSGRGVPRSDVTARHWFLAAANQGDAQAQFVLGKHYSNDDQTSLGWLWKAAQQGHQAAILELEVRLEI